MLTDIWFANLFCSLCFLLDGIIWKADILNYLFCVHSVCTHEYIQVCLPAHVNVRGQRSRLDFTFPACCCLLTAAEERACFPDPSGFPHHFSHRVTPLRLCCVHTVFEMPYCQCQNLVVFWSWNRVLFCFVLCFKITVPFSCAPVLGDVAKIEPH